MGERPLQVSRAVLGFDRPSRGWRWPAVAVLAAAAAVSTAPEWWGQRAASVARALGLHWPAAVLALAAVVLALVGRRRAVPTALGRRPRAPRMPLVAHVALLLGLAAVVAGGAGLLLWGVLGRPAGDAAGWSVQNRLDAMKVVLAVVGGAGAVVALAVAYRRQRLNEVDAYREDAKVVLDRFGKAAELLGAPDAAVRTAGVYAIAALANDAAEARQGCIDVLCAYLRQPFDAERDPRQERPVRRTVLRLIRDNLHLRDDDPRTWRGHDFDFTGAVFDGGDFAGATFAGQGVVRFDDAAITGRLSFAGAVFAGGIVSFDGARVDGGWICLRGVEFAGGVVDLSGIAGDAGELWPAGVAVPDGLRLPLEAVEVERGVRGEADAAVDGGSGGGGVEGGAGQGC
ncbi:pentapeptide repeat-containing protein [Actinokineospora sp. NPDC004072]